MNSVILPCGEAVVIPESIDETWFEHNKSGHMDPKLLAPYLNQVRTYIDPKKLDELEASIKSQGVRESLVVTPMKYAPWAAVAPEHTDLPFLIVSGHRRARSAIAKEVAAVPIEVRIYANEAAFDDDAATLNDHRQDISPIEEGWRYRKKIESGETIQSIHERTGYSLPVIKARVRLTFLCPKIQELISPRLDRRDRLATGFAAALGSVGLGRKFSFDQAFDFEAKLTELGAKEPWDPDAPEDEQRFQLQHAYLRYCRGKNWKGKISEDFILHGKQPTKNTTSGGWKQTGAKSAGAREKPSGLRLQLIDWVQYLNETGFLDMSDANIKKALSNAVGEDLEALADRIDMVTKTLRTIAKNKPKYSPEALAGQKRLELEVLKN